MNVVLITIDDLRADHLGCYGYKRNTSPNIDAIAREGALFTQAIAQSSHTPTSIGAMATSTYPPMNQLLDWGASLIPGISTLPEILKAYGYRTIFVGGNDRFREYIPVFGRGFDLYHDKNVGVAPALTQKAAELVGKKTSAPFFLWVHYMDVHQYALSRELNDLFVNDSLYDRGKKLPIVKDGPGRYGYKGISQFMAENRMWNDNPDYYIALYDGAIRTVDEQIGLLLKSLGSAGSRRNTLVIITSDHGELMGEHGYYFHHGFFLYEPLIRVPFILRCPGLVPAEQVDLQISATIDVLPTILGALKIKKSGVAQGVDLLTMLKINAGGSSYVISDEGNSRMRKSIRTDNWKLIYTPGQGNTPRKYELFNLKNDPGELNNLASTEKEVFIDLEKRLTAYRKRFQKIKTSPPVLSEEARKGLRALGYLQ